MRSLNRKSRLATCATAALAVAAGALALSASAGAATFNATDATSFAAAVASANSASTGPNIIAVAPGVYQPTATAVFTNTQPVTIQGPALAATVKSNQSNAASFSGQNVTSPSTGSPLFQINAGATVTIAGIEVTGAGVAGVNPAIDNFGTLTVTGVDIAGNGGTGVNVEPGATGTFTNATISDNSDFGLIDAGASTLTNVTVTTNTNGGIANTGTLNLTNTIVAQNGPGAVKNCTKAATTTDAVIDNSPAPSSCGLPAGPLVGTNPNLNTLNPYGGPTPTHAPKAGSIAIDSADSTKCPAVDERGAARPDDAGTACDIGAVERYSGLAFTNANTKVGIVGPAGTTKSVTFAALAPGAGAPFTSTCTPTSPQTITSGNAPAGGPPVSITCNGTDAFGNAATTTFTITGFVATPPTVTVPPDQTATSPDGSAQVVNYPPATASDTVDGSITPTCSPASGSSFPVGSTAVNCSATNSSGQTTTQTFNVIVTFSGDHATNNGNISGTVPFALSITAFTATFPNFGPGAVNLGSTTTATYNTSAVVTVTSSDASTDLNINDTSTAPTTGHLVNGTYSLAQPVNEEATSSSPFAQSVPAGPAFQPLTGSPTKILHYTQAVSNDNVGLAFRQVIGNTEGLHRGTYAATVLLQLVGTP